MNMQSTFPRCRRCHTRCQRNAARFLCRLGLPGATSGRHSFDCQIQCYASVLEGFIGLSQQGCKFTANIFAHNSPRKALASSAGENDANSAPMVFKNSNSAR